MPVKIQFNGSSDDINNKAYELRNKYAIDNVIRFDSYKEILKDYGGILHYHTINDFNVLLKVMSDKFYIYLKDNEIVNYSFYRQTFTIALALGYYFLHVDKINGKQNDELDFFHKDDDISYKQVIKFATNFILPKELFIEKCNEFNNNRKKLSQYFEISKPFIYVRMCVCGLHGD